VTRRALLATLIGVPILGTNVPALGAGAVITGRFDATGTERSERILNFGKAFAWTVNDAALWAQLEPLIGQDVTITVESA
jgi:hypothetical protein